MNLTFDSTKDEIAKSLIETLKEIKVSGETPKLRGEMLLKFGRLKLIDNEFKEAYEIFKQCNIHIMDNNLPELPEIYYWTARIFEANGELERAVESYKMILKRQRFHSNLSLIDETLSRLKLISKRNSTE